MLMASVSGLEGEAGLAGYINGVPAHGATLAPPCVLHGTGTIEIVTMRLFVCQNCGQLLYFENTQCASCNATLGFVPSATAVRAIEADGDLWREMPAQDGAVSDARFRICANARSAGCNWLVPAEDGDEFCVPCRHNHTIPDLSVDANIVPWRALEAAKRRLFYGLMRLCLPLATRKDDPGHGLAFDFLAETPATPKVMTGHDDGLITIALKEGDDAARRRMQQQMGELYRTPLGHFRHEIGHYYWDILVRDGDRLEDFRAVFGDERADYGEALKAHYGRTDNGAWRENYVSLYASSHPWEDFAETWAHYMHIVDTLEMARAFGIAVNPSLARDPSFQTEVDFDPYRATDMQALVETWLPLTYAVNSLNRSMGQPDLYPFVLPPAVVTKLGFIHGLVGCRPGVQSTDTRPPDEEAVAEAA